MNDEIIKLCKLNSYNIDYFNMGESISNKYFSLVSNLLNFNKTNDGVSKEIVYRNRIKLYIDFYEEHKKALGTDAGIEQQIGNLVVEIVNDLADFNWDDIYP